MAQTTVLTQVGTSAVALHTAAPTSVKVKNLGTGIVYIGPTGAGTQRYPLMSGQSETFAIGGTDVLFGISESGVNPVVVWHI